MQNASAFFTASELVSSMYRMKMEECLSLSVSVCLCLSVCLSQSLAVCLSIYIYLSHYLIISLSHYLIMQLKENPRISVPFYVIPSCLKQPC